MASCEGSTLEYWIDESVYNVSPDIRHQIVKLLEPFRSVIEQQIENYEPEEQSWRDYRNAMWYTIPEDIEKQVDELIKQEKKQ